MGTAFKDFRVRGLAGVLDTRDQPEFYGLNGFALVKNASVRGRGKRCRRGGWKKLYDGVNTPYNNEDLHDQLLGLSFYYESLSTVISEGRRFSGEYTYEYFIPGVHIPGESFSELLETVCGYALDYVPPYTFLPINAVGIDIPWWLGYPYVLEPTVQEPDVCAVYSDPYWYQLSYFNLSYNWLYADVDTEDYFYGTMTPQYNAARSYNYAYCGAYPFSRSGCEEYVSFIGSVGNSDGNRSLVVATRSRIYSLVQSTGNWRIVADGLGAPPVRDEDCTICTPDRWSGANLENVMVLANGVNNVLAFNPNSEPSGCDVWRATVIQDLVDLDVRTARCVGAWKTFVFLGDVDMDGARRRNRVLWSDSGDPLAWIPDDDNLAGYQDLGNDETILRVEGLNDFLFVYTDKSIYRGALVQAGDTVSFVFEELYRGEDSMKYRYAFANSGDAHYFWSKSRLLRLTSFDNRPVEVPFMRAVSNSIFDGLIRDDLRFGPLNEDSCDNFIGGFNPQFKEVWFSWPTDDRSVSGVTPSLHVCPNMSIVFNVTPNEAAADFVDAGFTAFHWFDGRRTSTLMEFLEDIEACSREEIVPRLIKEGPPAVGSSSPFTDPPEHIWNETEDPTLPASDSSLCTKFMDHWLRDICGQCETLSRFVMACTLDRCLKEYADTSYYREHLDGDTYILDGYDTVMQSSTDDLKVDEEKVVNKLRAAFVANQQTTPNTLYGYLGYGPDPDCITWKQLRVYSDCETLLEGLPLKCATEMTAEEHAAAGTRPDDNAMWPTEIRGQFFAWKLKITGTGGGACFSSVSLGVSKVG